MNNLMLEQLERRIPEILTAAVREHVVIYPIWTCPGSGAPTSAAMGPPPPATDPGWHIVNVGERWGATPGQDPGYQPPRLDWDIAPTGGSTHWLRCALQVPASWQGQSVHLALHWEGNRLDQVESIVYLNGVALAGLDWGHRTVQLPAEAHAQGGEILMRCAVAFPRPFGGAELQLRDEIIFKLGHSMQAMLGAVRTLAADAPERYQLAAALERAYQALDLRAGWQSKQFADSARAALRDLSIGQQSTNVGTQPLNRALVASGHGHLDVAWLWPLWRTRQKVAHTVATALQLIERYPDYHFSMSQPQVYAYLKQDDPQLYARLKARVNEGRVEPVGMMWVEPDCNLPAGESLIRQLVHGRRFFAAEFPERYGSTMAQPHVAWLPDVFGFNAALPQILRGCGIDCFMTTKLSWNQTNRYPSDTFRWRGIDGSAVLAHFLTTSAAPPRHPSQPQWFAYGGPLGAGEAIGTWRHYRQQALNHELLVLFGHADGGGGPDEDMLETLRALTTLPGLPRIRQGRADQFFAELYARVWQHPQLPEWSGELYFEYHRGTYTSQAAIKRANRAAELQYRQAEWLNAWAVSMGAPNLQARLDAGWEKILLNQFHDILPGSSIAAVYTDACADYAAIEQIGTEVTNAALEALFAEMPSGLIVVNSLPWARSEIVRLPFTGGVVPEGAQLIEERSGELELLCEAEAPAYGYAQLDASAAATACLAAPPRAQRDQLVNDELQIKFNEYGEICSLYDLVHTRELVLPGSSLNQLVLYEDRPLDWDAWDIDSFYAQKGYPLHDILDWRVVEAGPLRAAVEIRRRFGQSTITQRICLWRTSRRIDIVSETNWQERQMLLRALFPLNLNANKATCEIQFGALERPTHRNTSWDQARFEVCAQRWVDLSEGGYGVALLNNGIYGHSLQHSTLGLSLLKGAIFPDPDADRGVHRFTYSLYPHAGDWCAAQVVRRAYELNAPLLVVAHQATPMVQPEHMPSARSFLSLASEHVVAETVKVADDGDGLIVRLYEAHNQRGPVALTFARPVLHAEETDLLEQPCGPVAHLGATIHCAMRPFEIKTLRVRLG